MINIGNLFAIYKANQLYIEDIELDSFQSIG